MIFSTVATVSYCRPRVSRCGAATPAARTNNRKEAECLAFAANAIAYAATIPRAGLTMEFVNGCASRRKGL